MMEKRGKSEKEVKSKKEERRGKKTEGSTGGPKNERLAEDALAAETPEIDGQPCDFSRAFLCCVSFLCFFFSSRLCPGPALFSVRSQEPYRNRTGTVQELYGVRSTRTAWWLGTAYVIAIAS